LKPRDDASAFTTVFSGFRLITVSDAPPGIDPQGVVVSSLQPKHPLVPSFTPGRIYVFDKTTKMGSVTFAKWILPFRLWRAGAHLTQRANHMLYPFIGGPLYMVQFSKDGNRGVIFNRIKSVDQGKVEETLVFVYLNGREQRANMVDQKDGTMRPPISIFKPTH
jgi:hypothetical protein